MSVLAQAEEIVRDTVVTIESPSIEYRMLAPMLIVFGAAIVGVLVEAFVPARARKIAGLVVALLGLIGALAFVVYLAGERDVLARGAVAIDGPALFLQGTILALAATSLLVIAERPHADELPTATGALRPVHTEAFSLAMFSVGGMMLFVSANNLIVMFIALEVLSLPLYLLCGLARRRRLISQESALKYFLLGAFSSAFFLYGLALLYGYAGSVSLPKLAEATAVPTSNDALLYAGLALLAVGLLFKAGAAPFHFWTPDVYQGAPTGVTALMAACTKVAAFGALLRVMLVPFYSVRGDWRPSMAAVAILTMVVGSVIAVTQTDVKRMLAYSSVAHAGFILTGVVASNREGLKGSMFYLAAYGFTVIGGFAIVTLVRDAGGEATHLSRWQGLGKRSPAVAGLFAFFLFALAGIPLTSGFTGKFAVFQAAIEGGSTYLVIVGVVCSAIAAFFYARVVVLMFFQEPAVDGPTVIMPPALTSAALALSVIATIVLGVAPQLLLRVAGSADQFIR